MKRVLSFLLVMAMLFACAPVALAAEQITSGDYTYTVHSNKASIVGCDTAISGDVTIPSVLDGYPVVGIDYYAFSRCIGLTSVEIPAGVTSIATYAFDGCNGLTSVEIPASVTSIGCDVFRDCDKLTSVTFGDISGWYVTEYVTNWEDKTGGTVVTLYDTDFAANADLVRSTYYGYYWYKVD